MDSAPQPPTRRAPTAKSTPFSKTDRDAADIIGMSQSWLRKDRRRPVAERRGPAFIRVGRSVRYQTEDLEAWVAAHRDGGR